jgi:hypothetical protein
MKPSDLTVYKSPFPKVRIGKDYDGGYIICEIPDIKYTTLLAGGIAGDISFEEQFIRKYEGTKCFAFDGTINKLPKENTNITFIKKNIGYNNNDKITNLHDIIELNTNIFVKMDIEGGEIDWIKSLTYDHFNKFEQIVMEFHNPFTRKEANTFSTINKTHVLVHFHGNNCCGMRIYKGVNIPKVFECTYLHKKYFVSPPKLSTESIPSSIDMKNIKKDEVIITWPPFVNLKN